MEKGGHTTRGIICTTLGAVLWAFPEPVVSICLLIKGWTPTG